MSSRSPNGSSYASASRGSSAAASGSTVIAVVDRLEEVGVQFSRENGDDLLLAQRQHREHAVLAADIGQSRIECGEHARFLRVAACGFALLFRLGARRFVHAPSSGGKVRSDNLDASYWRKHFVEARRL